MYISRFSMMYKILLFVAALAVAAVHASTQLKEAKLAVLKSPNYQVYDFDSKSVLRLSDFKNLILAANGFSIEKVFKSINTQ
jgi:hypothetical protein